MKTPKLIYLSGIAIGLFSLLFDSFYNFTTLLCIIHPIFQFLVYKFKFKINNPLSLDDNNPKNINLGLLLPIIALITRFWFNCNIFINTNYWIYNITLLTIIIIAIDPTLKITRHFKKETIRNTISSFFILTLYTSTTIAHLNAILDFSKPKSEKVKITNTDKHYTRSGGHQFYISFTSINNKESKTISVSEYLYSKCEKGDIKRINFRNGFFNIPWINK